MTTPHKTSILILTWNGRQHLEACLPALRDQEPPDGEWEVLVFDNGSTDGTAGWLRQAHPEVRLVESPVNLGFCGGNNRLAEEADGDALVLLNNDTRPHRDWLRVLVDALRSAPEDVAAVSGRIVDWTGERLDFASGLLTFDGHAFQRDYGRPLGEVEIPAAGSELPFACGGNMIVRRESFLAAGGFDGDYFAYLEDVDLGWRLWSGGERVLFAPDAVVHHRSMASSDQLGMYNRGFLFERNAFLTAYKNYDADWWPRIMPAILLTLMHRTQTLLVENNPGGEQLTVDPYAGKIANTGPVPEAPPVTPPDAAGLASLHQKWRDYGGREFLKRGLRKAVRSALPSWILDDGPPTPAPLDVPQLVDGRTVAQFRAIHRLMVDLDRAAESRQRVQARRRRGDREIFERFPLWVIPTYPGDEQLFDSPAFAAWLDGELPIRRARLEDVMAF